MTEFTFRINDGTYGPIRYKYTLSYLISYSLLKEFDFEEEKDYNFSYHYAVVNFKETAFLKILKEKDSDKYNQIINYNNFNKKFKDLINE